MTAFNFQGERDKALINGSFYYLAKLVFGSNKDQVIENFRKLFELKVKQVNVYPQGTVTEHISPSVPGICRFVDSDNNILVVDILGYINAEPSQYKFIQHEGVHEFCHAFADLLHLVVSKYPNGIVNNGVKYENHAGMISEKDAITGEHVGSKHYGKMYNETMMDIITAMAINSFDENSSRIWADDILNKNYLALGNVKTGYSIFTTITRLTIAAFCNVGSVNYQTIVNSGDSIFTKRVRMQDGSDLYANDFLYGIMFDHLYIEQEYDKFMGKGKYRDLCKLHDTVFHNYLQKNQQIPVEYIKRVMKTLADFLNKKLKLYLENGMITEMDKSNIISKFNAIWISSQTEYSAYFSANEISEIVRDATEN